MFEDSIPESTKRLLDNLTAEDYEEIGLRMMDRAACYSYAPPDFNVFDIPPYEHLQTNVGHSHG